mgnify:CR=1 FL=1
MKKETSNSTCKYPSTFDELIDDMEEHPDRYKHLQIFLTRECFNGLPEFGEKFLAVSRDEFVLYRLDAVDYQNGSIILSLTEASTNQSMIYTLNIYDEKPSHIFIRWKDIEDMMCADSTCCDTNDDLLELDSN